MTKITNRRLDKLEQTVQEIKARNEDLVDITADYEMLEDIYGGVYTGPRVYITREQFERQERDASIMLEMYVRANEQAAQNKLEHSQSMNRKE